MNVQEKLSMGVLVLNQSYEALQICNVKRAIKLVLKEKASIIEHIKDIKLKSVTREFLIPSIIRIERYIQINRYSIKLNKENIFKRDNYTCQYCGKNNQPMTIDHIIPKIKGGKDSWINLVTACQSCNNKKGRRDLKETNLSLLIKPKKPHRLYSLQSKMIKNRDEWKIYLYLD